MGEKIEYLDNKVDIDFNTLCLTLDKTLNTKELEMSIVDEEEILPITFINNQGDIVSVGDGNESYFVKKNNR